MTIHIIRHTSVDIDKGICYGQNDVPVKDTFIKEATIVKSKLENLPKPDVAFSSPLSRCTKLAAFCGFEDAIRDDRLMEINFGDWQMQRWDDIDMSVWESDWITNPAPNGESFIEMYNRVAQFFDEIKSRDYTNVFIFAHAGVINCARIYFGKATFETAFDEALEYGEVVSFES